MAVLAFLIMGAVIVLGVLFPGGLAIKTNGGTSVLTISATGTATGYPAQATLYLEVNGSGSTSQVATANLSFALARVNSTLSKYIDQNLSNIQTTSYSLARPYNSTSYVAQEGLKVTLPNVSNVSPAIGALSGIGSVRVNDASAVLSDRQAAALRAQALSAAMANATAQAHTLLGPNATIAVRNVTVNSYNFYPYPVGYSALVASASSGGAQAPSFYSGTQGVTESVTVSFSYSG